MITEFPISKEGEVLLSRADTNTGTVLDESFNYALNSTQKVYTIFDNNLEAVGAAKKMIAERPAAECYIHKAPDELLYFLNSTGVKKFNND